MQDLPTEKLFYTPCRSGEGIFGDQNLIFRIACFKDMFLKRLDSLDIIVRLVDL